MPVRPRTQDVASPADVTTGTAPAPLLRVEGLVKRYGSTRAVDDLDFELAAGEIHGLCGHNGAGKSTLVGVLRGTTTPDAGSVRIDGVNADIGSPVASQQLGIAVVEQELAQVPEMSVADNLFLGHPQTPWLFRRQRPEAERYLKMVGLGDVDPSQPLRRLRLGERQLLEIARLLTRDARILILDEPTATLTSAEIERVFSVIRALVDQGRAAIFVTHRLGEVFTYCDRVSVMRDGRRLATRKVADMQRDDLVDLMVDVEALAGPASETSTDVDADAPTLMSLREIELGGAVGPVSLDVPHGHVVALAGQVGAGATELLRAVAGLDRFATGEVILAGRSIGLGRRTRAARAGISYVPDDRAADGLFFGRRAFENLTASSLRGLCRGPVITRAAIIARARELASGARYDAARLDAPPETLSGGNQQKLLVGRAVDGVGKSSVLLLCEPTRGVDIQSRHEIYEVIRAVAARGAGVVFVSTDLEEITELGDVIYTMFRGQIVGRHRRQDARSARILAEMTHGREQDVIAVAQGEVSGGALPTTEPSPSRSEKRP